MCTSTDNYRSHKSTTFYVRQIRALILMILRIERSNILTKTNTNLIFVQKATKLTAHGFSQTHMWKSTSWLQRHSKLFLLHRRIWQVKSKNTLNFLHKFRNTLTANCVVEVASRWLRLTDGSVTYEEGLFVLFVTEVMLALQTTFVFLMQSSIEISTHAENLRCCSDDFSTN